MAKELYVQVAFRCRIDVYKRVEAYMELHGYKPGIAWNNLVEAGLLQDGFKSDARTIEAVEGAIKGAKTPTLTREIPRLCMICPVEFFPSTRNDSNFCSDSCEEMGKLLSVGEPK
jgi:hypothetical protein